MTKGRLEAFSDGVLAIIITIMVLELSVPTSADLHALVEVLPEILTYVLSFVFLGIYWNNHHHLLHASKRITGGVLWANLHLLFWLSLVPFVTGYMENNDFAPLPTAIYGVVMLLAGLAYLVLTRALIAAEGPGSRLAEAIGGDAKGLASILLYASSVPLAFVTPWVSIAIYIGVALMWLVPDKRIERTLG